MRRRAECGVNISRPEFAGRGDLIIFAMRVIFGEQKVDPMH